MNTLIVEDFRKLYDLKQYGHIYLSAKIFNSTQFKVSYFLAQNGRWYFYIIDNITFQRYTALEVLESDIFEQHIKDNIISNLDWITSNR